MTRKDYQLIASAIDNSRPEILGANSPDARQRHDTCDLVARTMAKSLAADNPNFDRDRFLRACGVE